MGGIINTNRNSSSRGPILPRLEGEQADVFPGSPLAVIGLWVFALRNRFNLHPGEPLPWVWSSDLRPDDAEDGEPLPDGSPRKMLIESAYNIEKPERNYRPAIYVGRGGNPVRTEKIMLDNKVGVQHTTQLKAYHCLAHMPLSIDCQAESSGASSAIAETAWAYILTTRDIYRSDFGFHDITEPVLGDTAAIETDKEVWETSISFQVTYDMRWRVTPITPILQDIQTEIRTAGIDGSTFFERIALRE